MTMYFSHYNGIIITFMLSLSEITLICENRQKYAHFESLICEKKFGTSMEALVE